MKNKNELKQCVIAEGAICDDCGFCNTCDLDPDKVCDNGMKCLDEGDYNAVIIEKSVERE